MERKRPEETKSHPVFPRIAAMVQAGAGNSQGRNLRTPPLGGGAGTASAKLQGLGLRLV